MTKKYQPTIPYSRMLCCVICGLQSLLQRDTSFRSFAVDAFMGPFRRTYPLKKTFLLDSANNSEGKSINLPPLITTKALAQIYPALIEHKEQYGNPNIPLGTPEGRQCYNIRRVQSQGKLSDVEVEHLEELGFIFHTLEDLYEHADFDEMEARLKTFKAENGHLDIKKKHAPDPELGAWVTGIRRLGRGRVAPEHVERLDALGFLWVSPRQCGSKFMIQFREIQERIENGESKKAVFEDPEVARFIRAQKEAFKRKTISETRIDYLNRLFGDNWWGQD